jgi:hypothetical protein
MSAKHTPGPWHAVDDNFVEAENGATVIDQINDDLSELSDEEISANARLIAAAPDLLAALRKLEIWLECTDNAEALEYTRAAIAKAEEERP